MIELVEPRYEPLSARCRDRYNWLRTGPPPLTLEFFERSMRVEVSSIVI